MSKKHNSTKSAYLNKEHLAIFQDLKKRWDAPTDSEVLRRALRMAHTPPVPTEGPKPPESPERLHRPAQAVVQTAWQRNPMVGREKKDDGEPNL